MFSIFDSKAEAFISPWFLPEIEMAKRTFSDCVNSTDHQFSKHSGDYTLFHLGTFSQTTGEFVLNSTPISLGLAQYYKRKEDQDEMFEKVTAIK